MSGSATATGTGGPGTDPTRITTRKELSQFFASNPSEVFSKAQVVNYVRKFAEITGDASFMDHASDVASHIVEECNTGEQIADIDVQPNGPGYHGMAAGAAYKRAGKTAMEVPVRYCQRCSAANRSMGA